MAKSKNIVIRGRAYWARVYEGNADEFGGKEFYKITVIPDGESWSKFAQSGLGIKPKPVGDNNEDALTFRRDKEPKTGVNKDGPWSIGGGAPRVVNAHGETITALIGNESKVEVLVEVYEVPGGPMKGKKGHRLEAVKVIDLVKYESPVDFSDSEDDEAPFDTTPEVKHEAPKKASTKGLPF